MLTFQDLVSQYWKYYLALENRFLETERYVEFDLSNGMVYSMEYMMLFQTICSEIEKLMPVSVSHHSKLINVQV